ncbi:MAG TPA: type II toxin-antitoxin system VapC family toxin [Bryobacteraceae bacterium]|nr:type II toxin-antitoxin system VapC family toxin [Bryobacteraceae bacterium]
MAWLLDTNILSEGRKPRPEPRVTAFYNKQPLNQLYISVVSVAEIRFGIELLEDPSRRAELNAWLTSTLRPAFAGRILPITEDILLKWRLLMEEGRKVGHTYSHPDLVLAATALHHGLTVVTRDRSDFDKARVPVFNPWEQ